MVVYGFGGYDTFDHELFVFLFWFLVLFSSGILTTLPLREDTCLGLGLKRLR